MSQTRYTQLPWKKELDVASPLGERMERFGKTETLCIIGETKRKKIAGKVRFPSQEIADMIK